MHDTHTMIVYKKQINIVYDTHCRYIAYINNVVGNKLITNIKY